MPLVLRVIGVPACIDRRAQEIRHVTPGWKPGTGTPEQACGTHIRREFEQILILEPDFPTRDSIGRVTH